MCKKHIIIVLALSLFLISSAGAATISWDFENGNDHRFNLWSAMPGWAMFDDPNTAGDESLTGVGAGGIDGLPGFGLAWTIGPPNQFDGLIPVVEEGCHIVDGVLQYGPCNDPFGAAVGDPPYDLTNSRGQSSYLNTYNLSQWGDGLHTAGNDQIATSPPVVLGENAVLTVWAHGGGSGTHAPEYDPDPAGLYTDGSSGIAVITADDYTLLASVQIGGKGTLREDTLDLSAFAGQTVLIEVVDAFEGGWGWLAVDEIQITNATSKTAGFVVQMTDDELVWGFDQAQYDHLQALGYNVMVVEQGEIGGGTFTRADANALDLLIISESIGSSSADPLRGTSAPVMHEEAYGWDNWNFMGPADNIHWLATQTEVEVVNDTHPIIVDANLPVGKIPWFTAPDQYTTENVSNMAPGAELLVKADADDLAVVFAVEQGAELADGSLAPNRRVGFSIPGNQDGPNQIGGIIDASIMTDEQWALYDAAIRWLDPPPVPPTAAMIVSSTDMLAGFDYAMQERLKSMGYVVTAVPSSDVGSIFTIAEAETFDVLVISESIGSSSADPLIGANVPMMHNESYGWDNHGFIDNANKGPAWVSDATAMDIVNDTHPISVDAGLSIGPLEFYINPGTSWTADLVSALAPGAVSLAQINSGGTDYVLVFAIEQGAELADGTPASNRIVGFSIPGNNSYTPDEIKDEGWAFWEAAIRWLDEVD
ncbi:MAG TPA: hypothetical protein VMW72_05720 [Sedimentisphaerales bacterium]|nr:hypothetical protein [Sedimentisphaerales bacterium]